MERSTKRSDDFTLAMVINEIRVAVKGRKRGSKLTAKYIANALQVTTHEAELLRDLHQTTSKGTWPPAEGQPELAPKMDRAQRKSVIVDWIVANGFQVLPPSRELAVIISDQIGMQVSHETLNQYRKGLRPPQPPPEMVQAMIEFAETTVTPGNQGTVS
jgi:hypothetical protein